MPPVAQAIVATHDIVLSRGPVRVLDGLSLTIGPGETVALQGPSGSGKSSLLQLMCGLLTPDSGTIEFAGQPFSTMSERSRSRVRLNSIGCVFQGDEFVPELTLSENVSLPLRLLGRERRSDVALSVVDDAMDRLGIADFSDRLPWQVSGGQLQRAAVARAVVHHPRLILADEPTASLDAESSAAAMTLLLDVASDIDAAVLVVTHSTEVAGLCSRQAQLRAGRLEPAGSAGSRAPRV